MRKHASPLLVALSCALLLVGLTACGSKKSDSSNVDGVLKATFAGGNAVKSGQLKLSLDIGAQGSKGSSPVAIKLGGPFQSQGKSTLPQFDFDLLLDTGKQKFAAGAVSTTQAGFVKYQGSTYALSPDIFQSFKKGFVQAQSKKNGSSSNPSFASLGINPRRWLKDAKNAGEANVAGVQTIHITAGIDTGKLLDDVNQILGKAGALGSAAGRLPTKITDAQKKQFEDAVKSAKFDLYSGKADKTLRKVTVNLAFDVPKSQQKAAGLSSGTLVFDLEIDALNQPQTITAPTGAKPFSELTQALTGGLSGLGGSSSSGRSTPATPAPVAPSPGVGGAAGKNSAQAQAYLQCIQSAGGDVAKGQKCASLLSAP